MEFAHVVVDGSNIATEARSLPSLRQLDEAVRALLAEHEVGQVTVIVDATFGHRIDSAERNEFDEAIANAEIITPPAGAIGRGDAFVIEVAERAGATILSNDSFQEFHGTHEWLFDEGRLIGGKPVPGVGWVFLHRSPVRGPVSRRSVREARKPKDSSSVKPKDGGRSENRSKSRTRSKAKKSDTPKTADEGRSRSGKGRRGDNDSARRPAPSEEPASAAKKKSRSRTPTKNTDFVNEPLPFLEFVAAHPVDTEVVGEVSSYASHGVYVHVDDARCYVPLKSLGEPAPRRARDVVKVGEFYRFAVDTIDAPRRGIDLRYLGDADRPAGHSQPATDRPTVSTGAEGTEPNDTTDLDDTGTTYGAQTASEEAPVTPAKKATKKAAKKTTKKATAKKAPAKKATKKAPAKKAATKKTTKKAPAKKSRR
ncbi:MAG: S1 RNA-binding domain-containing protein [Acidimicrobiia bacterium]|nr:S1 RNA-binding domain-containing protein [Acidimicrobiia bacterium]